MITWWNNTIFINTFFAIPTWSIKSKRRVYYPGSQVTSDATFLRSAFVAWSTIVIYWTFLGHADFVPTLIFICAVIVVFTSLVTFAKSAICQNGTFTFFATPNIIIAWSSWISNISIGYSPNKVFFLLSYAKLGSKSHRWLPGGMEQKLLIHFLSFGHCPLCIHPMIHFLEVHLLPDPQSLSVSQLIGIHLPLKHLMSLPQSRSASHDPPVFKKCTLDTVLK